MTGGAFGLTQAEGPPKVRQVIAVHDGLEEGSHLLEIVTEAHEQNDWRQKDSLPEISFALPEKRFSSSAHFSSIAITPSRRSVRGVTHAMPESRSE
jgi:hypothetical protein